MQWLHNIFRLSYEASPFFIGISKTIQSGIAEHCVQVHMGLLPGSPYYLTPPLVLFLKLSESFDIVPYEPGYIHLFFLIFSI